MFKAKIFFILALLPWMLSATYRERVKHVHLVTNETTRTDSLKVVQEAMKLKATTLKVTDLKNEKDSSELTYIVVWDKPDSLTKELAKFESKKALLYMWQSPVEQPQLYAESFLSQFKRIYTWDDALVDDKKYFKFYIPSLQPMRSDLPSFDERKLLTQIFSHKISSHPQELYSAQSSIAGYFQDKKEFEFYGEDASIDKHDILKNYKFSICYENMRDIQGYISEKIFDSFAVGTIPIYWGASNITDYIPKECFIDRRDFKNFDEVAAFIRSMDRATFETYQRNIKLFLESDKAKLFSQDMFHTLFLESVRFP